MNEKEREDAFLEKIRSTLDESSKGLDANTLSRLGAARRRALLELPGRGAGRGARRVWLRLSAAGFAAASAAILAVFIFLGGSPAPRLSDNLEDVEMLASGEQLEFLDELDFYAWLAENKDNAG